jgi:hypothetical protein
MSAWETVACLLTLRTEFNLVSPNRDKGADGTIGDAAHSPSSDHSPDEDSSVLRSKDADSKNEVHGLDVDSSGPWPDGKAGDVSGSWFDLQIHRIIAEEKRRWEDPNDMCRLNYIIWKKRIYSRSNNFNGEAYTGDDPHTNHAHFSARYETQAENDTRPWGVLEEDMALDAADLSAIVTKFRNTPEVLSDTNVNIIAAAAATAADTKVGARLTALDAKLSAFIAAEAKDDASQAAAMASLANSLQAITPALAQTIALELSKIAPEIEITQTQVNDAMETALRNVFSA